MKRNPLVEVLTATAFDRLGIAPIEQHQSDFNAVLAALPPDEARKMKRKFRKLWRKAVKRPKHKVSPVYLNQLGLGNPTPTKRNKTARKAEVSRLVRKEVAEAAKNLTEGVNNESSK